ncbi:MAG: D-alanine--D-alanine ligase [Bacteroidales bacterium]
MKKNIAIIAGGDSSEWVVSMKSAEGLMSFIDAGTYNRYLVIIRNKEWYASIGDEKFMIDKNDFSFIHNDTKITFDFAYITIHGTPGENGILQGYFDLIGLPYSCCGVLAAALTFNKYACNHYLSGFDIQIAPSIRLRKGEYLEAEDVVDICGMPCFIKPNVGGSSFGVTKVKNPGEIYDAVDNAFREGEEVIIESFIEGTEITCGCYKVKDHAVVFPITEVVSKNEFFDYEAKYTASKVEEITPARISDELTSKVQELTSEIYDLLGCKGIIRIDYIISKDKLYLLEVNTTPGMTATSFIPQQVRAAGLDIKDVMNEIIENEIKSHS